MRYYGCKEKLLDFIESNVGKTDINHSTIFWLIKQNSKTIEKVYKK